MDTPKKKTKKTSKDNELQLKAVISRTYSEGCKINIGNYQSRDFFASATRMQELPSSSTLDEREEVSMILLDIVKGEVKAALKAEVENASDTAPAMPTALNEKFHPELKVDKPWTKFTPRSYTEDKDEDEELK